jgi:hypothetical protein
MIQSQTRATSGERRHIGIIHWLGRGRGIKRQNGIEPVGGIAGDAISTVVHHKAQSC